MLFDIVLHKKLPSFGLDIELRSDARRLAVVGPSGSGKSLTLQLLAGHGSTNGLTCPRRNAGSACCFRITPCFRT